MRNDIMIDLETVGNDHDGLFTTIGACSFDIETGGIRDRFYESINWESALEAGRTVTPSTIKWWMEQPQDARAQIIKEGRPLKDVLMAFAGWIEIRCGEKPIVWGNGPIFDIMKLESAYGYYNIPWKFFNVRCVRTIRDLAKGLVDRKDIPFEGVKHNALDDAIHQAEYVSAMWKALRGSICDHKHALVFPNERTRTERLVCQDCQAEKVREIGSISTTDWDGIAWERSLF